MLPGLLSVLLLLTASFATAEDSVAVPRFTINEYKLAGNTILLPEQAAEILNRYIGLQRDFGDIQGAIEALEKAYRDLGFTMVTVILPEQELTMGTVRLQVLEPEIAEIAVNGNSYFNQENILSTLPTLRVGSKPKISVISENLRVANENPAKKITLQLKTPEDPEKLYAVIQVKDQKPWKFNVGGDNSGSDTTGLYRTWLGFQHFNLFNNDHVMALQYTTSPDHIEKVNMVSGSYRVPLYRLGDAIDFFGAYSDVNSGTIQVSGTDIKVSGRGIAAGFRYNMNLARFGEYEHKLIGGMDYRLYDNSAVASGTNLTTPVLAHPFNVAYGGILTTETLVVDGSLGLLYNIPWGGYGGNTDFSETREGAAGNYLITRYGLNFMIRPGADWIMRVATSGQYSNDRLIAGEQFGYGGSTILRGYREREESWDSGFSGSLEIYSPDLAHYLQIHGSQFRLLVFLDGGIGYNVRPQPGDLDSNSLKSAGAGFRFAFGEILSFNLDWGYAFDQSSQTRAGGSAVHFKGQLSY